MCDTESTHSTSDWHHRLTYEFRIRVEEFMLDVNLPKLQYNDHIPIPPTNADRDLVLSIHFPSSSFMKLSINSIYEDIQIFDT